MTRRVTTRSGRAMPFGKYAALSGISATALKAGTVSMLHMRHAIVGLPPPPREETPAMRWGRLTHLAVLEPQAYGNAVAVWTGGRRAGGEWGEFTETHGREWIVSADENAELLQMTAAAHGNAQAHRLIADSAHEQAVTWKDRLYGKGKARIDCLAAGWFADLKTTAQIGGFARQFFNLNYDVQFGWYAEGTRRPVAWVIVLESVAPWDVAVFRVPPHVMDSGRERAVELAKLYRACEAVGAWPGIEDGNGGRDLPVPAWYGNREEVATAGGAVADKVPTETMEASEL